MLNTPNPVLNEEEAALLTPQPEECLRRAVQRGAISLDQVTEELAPHVAAAVCSIVTGERLPVPPDGAPFPEPTGEQIRKFEQARGHPPTEAELEQMHEFVRMQTEQILDEGGAIAAANAIDHALGRYLTGTRYAAP
jgi:hypothetical protein